MRKLTPAVFLTLDPVRDGGEFLFGSGLDGYVYQLENGESDDGDDIEGKWTTGWLDMGEPESEKYFMRFHADLEAISDRLYVDWSVDYGVATGTLELRPPRGEGGVWHAVNATWDAVSRVWGGPPDIRKKSLLVDFPQEAQGQRIQITLRAEDKIKAWQVTNFSVLYRVSESQTTMADV